VAGWGIADDEISSEHQGLREVRMWVKTKAE